MKKLYLLIAGIFFFYSSKAQVYCVPGTTISSELLNGSSLSIVTTPLVTSNFMIVTVSEYQESYPLTIVDATASRNFTLGKSVVTSGGSLVGIYYLTNPGTGIHIINISSGTGNNANMKAIVSYYSGVDTQNPIANSASNKNPLGSMDNDPHLNITSAPGQMVVDALTYERPVSALTGDPSQITNAYINSNGWNNGSSHKPGATNVSMAWDYSQDIGSYWGIVALSLKAQPSNPLPIVLTDFWAQYKKPNVTLYWKTSQEINFSHFVIERSTEGTNYTDAGVVFAYGNAVDNTNYSFSDNLNNIQSGIVYYRLRSVDIDGKSQYSEIRIIRISKQTENAIGIVAFPNPVINEVRISIPGEWQNKKVTYEVLNANGQVAKRTEAGCSSQTETVNMSTLARGFYLVRVSCEGQTAQQKIVK